MISTPNEKKQSNYYVIETESKTKSSSIRDEKETVITNKTKRKEKKLKTNKTSVLHLNGTSKINSKIAIKKNYLNNNNNLKESYIQEDQNNKTRKIKISDIIKENYNLAEAYLRNNILEKSKKSKTIQECERMVNFRINEYINLKDKKNNNIINSNNKNNNLFSEFSDLIDSKNINSDDFCKYYEEKLEQEDFTNFSSLYRNKMIDKLKLKLNKDCIIDDSLPELESEKHFNIQNENKTQKYKNSILSNKKENKRKEFAFVHLTNKKNKNNKEISFTKNKKTNLLFGDILNNKLNKKKHLFLVKNSVINNNNIKRHFYIKLSKKNNLKINKKGNIFNNDINTINKKEYLTKNLINPIIQKNRLNNSHSLHKSKTINILKTTRNKRKIDFIIKKNNIISDLTYKNNLTNIDKENYKNVKSQLNIKSKNRVIIYNIKNQIINKDNNKINRTMVIENKHKKLSLPKNKNKTLKINRTDLNININKQQSTINNNNINYIKHNKKYYCKIFKKKTKIKIDFITPSMLEKKLNLKDNLHSTSKLNKSNDSRNEQLSIEKFFSCHKKQK